MCLWDSVEIDELQYPIRVDERRLVPDSEGAGRWRGAPALSVEFGPVGEPVDVIFAVDGRINGPIGVQGGLTGAPARNYRRLRRVSASSWEASWRSASSVTRPSWASAAEAAATASPSIATPPASPTTSRKAT